MNSLPVDPELWYYQVVKQILSETAALQYSTLRALLYTLESLPLPLINRWIAGKVPYKPTREEQNALIREGRALLKTDARDFARGVYPLTVYSPEPVWRHVPRLGKVLLDGAMASYRRRKNRIKEFSSDSDEISRFPNYYQRNFHHQTDGYLSETSAELYEHQVELLFRGLAQPMRRRLLAPMVKALGDGTGINILEYACGSGAFTRMLAEVFPRATITAVDLSPSYVKHARSQLSDKKNVHFLTMDAEHFSFKDETFDAAVGVYLHHELPRAVRKSVCLETFRVLKKGGFWGMLDSLQLGDMPELDWALNEFPKTFHEPFYKDYIGYPLLKLLSEAGLPGPFNQEVHFLSKVVTHQGKAEPSQE